MLNLKLGLSALGLEISAWSTAWWLQERSDGALLSYLALHAGASVLLSLSLLPLVPKRIAQPRWAALLLMIACSYGIPIAGFIGVVLAFITLHLYREKLGPVAFDSVQLPEFDQHQKRHSNQHHVGLRSFLGNTQAPLDSRLRAMAALQYVPGRTASPLLRTVLSDPSEDLRLLAYGMLDTLEKRLHRALDHELDPRQAAEKVADEARILQSSQRLSDLYWELIYQDLVQGDLHQHALRESLRYCEEVLRSEPDNASLVLRQGRLLHALARHDEAQSAYARARALGLPATRILPYQAELCFAQRDFAQTRALMQELGQWSALPRLRPVIDYWTSP